MRTWEYIEPGPNGEVIRHRITDREILRKYFLKWGFYLLKIRGIQGLKYLTAGNCILDFATIFWATEVDDNGDHR